LIRWQDQLAFAVHDPDRFRLLAAFLGLGDEQKIGSPNRDHGVSGFRGCCISTTRLSSASGAATETAPVSIAPTPRLNGVLEMNKDRVEGAVENVGGKIKEAAGKSTGDQKMVAAGQAEQKIGKVQNAVGGLKDTVRDIQKGK
jgi:uncharacterized protein YjbJ (UPF0337 family)